MNQVRVDPRGLRQLVRWGPTDGGEPGISVESVEKKDFIPWIDLKEEVERALLPQVRLLPIGCTVEVGDLGDRKHWIIRVVSPEGDELANVWFGTDGDDGWKWDGGVRVGDPNPPRKRDLEVWQTFQRYSDGSYRRIAADAVTKDEATRPIGL